MVDERIPWQIIAELAATARASSNDQVLAQLTAIPPLADEDDPCWDDGHHWVAVANPYLALWEAARTSPR